MEGSSAGMRRPKLIGLVGYAGSGKSTAAEHIQAVYRYDRIKFAGTLKRMLRSLGLSLQEVDGDLKEKPCDLLCGKTPRYAMQTLGTEWGRDLIHPDIWVNSTMRLVDSMENEVVIDDVRFESEMKAIRIRGGVLWYVFRPEVHPLGAHVSEAGPVILTKKYQYKTLDNSGDLTTLHTNIKRLLD